MRTSHLIPLLAVSVLVSHPSCLPLRAQNVEYNGTYTNYVSNCGDPSEDGDYEFSCVLVVTQQTASVFDATAIGSIDMGGQTYQEHITFTGTIDGSGQVQGTTTHTFLDTAGEGTFIGILTPTTLDITNTGHDTVGGTCSYTRLFTLTNTSAVTYYAISVSASPSAGGTVTGGGVFPSGSLQTVTATANSGYTFADWTQNGNVASSSPSYTFTLNEDMNLVANFVQNTTDFTFITNSGMITITGYIGSGGEVTIPSIINGYPVTTIGPDAFYGQTNLTDVTIPDGVTSIGDAAFVNCSGLTSMTIPNSVTGIGVEVFYDCYSLTNVTIGNSVTNIAEYAFYNCYGLTNVTIGNSVANIGDSAFFDCSSLTNLTIPNNVTNIGAYAFYGGYGLTSVTIPDRVTNIGEYAFFNCYYNLTNVTIGNSVASIGADAFGECPGLKSVTIPSSVTNIGKYAFVDCWGLQEAYCQGNAPSVDGVAGSADSTVFSGESGTVYYVPGSTGWGVTFGGWPTAQWYRSRPQILGTGLETQGNRFQFTISWATNVAVVVEASTNLQDWIPISTNTLSNGTNAFEDSNWTHYPQRFYRVRNP